MSTELDTGQRASGPPGAKLRTIGDHLNFAVVDIDNDVPMTKFGTDGEPDLRKDGKQKMAVRLTVLATGGQAFRKEDGVDVAIQPGELVSIYISSYAKYDPDNDKTAGPDNHVSWSTAIERLTASGAKFGVGTVGQYAYLQDFPPSQAGNDPRKDRKFALRAAAPEEAAQSQQCEQLRVELHAAANPPTQLADGTNTPNTPTPNLGAF